MSEPGSDSRRADWSGAALMEPTACHSNRIPHSSGWREGLGYQAAWAGLLGATLTGQKPDSLGQRKLQAVVL